MIGRREVVGLGIFAIAALTALTFLDPTAFSTSEAPVISNGDTPPTAAPATPEPTATPVTESLAMPSSWFLSFFTVAEDGTETFYSRATVPSVDLSFASSPVGQLRDDAWSVVAEAPIGLEAGRYQVRVVHDGAVEVSINGAVAATADDGEGEHVLEVTFDHDGQGLVLGVKGRDVSGPFALRVEPGSGE